MEEDFETCVFRWYVHNPFLPSETKEAIFCFRSPKVTKWKAFLQRGKGSRAVNNWPVSFCLQYFPPDDEELTLEVDVSVNFVEVGNEIPSHVHVFFCKQNKYTYTYNSSIRPEHGKLEIIVEILIPQRYKEVIELAPNDLKSLSNDLKKIRSQPLYFDMWLQSRDPDTRFPVHSYILDARWFHFFKELSVRPNADYPPTVETDISPDVLDGILTYLYSGSVKHFNLRNPSFEGYRTELFQAMDRYPIHHLCMMFEPKPKSQFRDTITHLSSSVMIFRLEEVRKLDSYVWTHSPLPGVSATTSVSFFDLVIIEDKFVSRPSLCYTLRFTNAVKLSARVNLEYRRKVVGWDSEMRRILYECDHEIPCNGTKVSIPVTPMVGSPSHLLRFKKGGDRREGRHVVEHSFRFILYLSRGDKSIATSRLDKFPDDDEELSFNILSKHMSRMLRREIGANLKATVLGGAYRRKLYRLHKAIFVFRASKWQAVVDDVPDEDTITDKVKLGEVNNDAFPFAIEFLYTGTCSPIRSKALLRKIIHFAIVCGIASWQDIYAFEYRRSQDIEQPPMELE